MRELAELVTRTQAGDLDAYGEIVRRFQDMAYGYGYSMLGDFSAAEDAAQESFIQAYRELANLREPEAFPGWFRRIVYTQCAMVARRNHVQTVPLDDLAEMASAGADPHELAERSEMRDRVLGAIRALPENERVVTALFYINGYSHNDIAGFPRGAAIDGQEPAAHRPDQAKEEDGGYGERISARREAARGFRQTRDLVDTGAGLGSPQGVHVCRRAGVGAGGDRSPLQL